MGNNQSSDIKSPDIRSPGTPSPVKNSPGSPVTEVPRQAMTIMSPESSFERPLPKRICRDNRNNNFPDPWANVKRYQQSSPTAIATVNEPVTSSKSSTASSNLPKSCNCHVELFNLKSQNFKLKLQQTNMQEKQKETQNQTNQLINQFKSNIQELQDKQITFEEKIKHKDKIIADQNNQIVANKAEIAEQNEKLDSNFLEILRLRVENRELKESNSSIRKEAVEAKILATKVKAVTPVVSPEKATEKGQEASDQASDKEKQATIKIQKLTQMNSALQFEAKRSRTTIDAQNETINELNLKLERSDLQLLLDRKDYKKNFKKQNESFSKLFNCLGEAKMRVKFLEGNLRKVTCQKEFLAGLNVFEGIEGQGPVAKIPVTKTIDNLPTPTVDLTEQSTVEGDSNDTTWRSRTKSKKNEEKKQESSKRVIFINPNFRDKHLPKIQDTPKLDKTAKKSPKLSSSLVKNKSHPLDNIFDSAYDSQDYKNRSHRREIYGTTKAEEDHQEYLEKHNYYEPNSYDYEDYWQKTRSSRKFDRRLGKRGESQPGEVRRSPTRSPTRRSSSRHNDRNNYHPSDDFKAAGSRRERSRPRSHHR